MRVTFEIPDQIWGRLASIADDGDTDVPTLMTLAAARIVNRDAARVLRAAKRHERVLRGVRAGLTDAEIALRTGDLKNYVADVRRGAGLPANRRQRQNINERKTA